MDNNETDETENTEASAEAEMAYCDEDESEENVASTVRADEFAEQVEILTSTLAGEKEVTIEDFEKAKRVCGEILKKKIRFNYSQLDKAIDETFVDIKGVNDHNYSQKLKEVAGYRDYFIEQEGRVRAYVKWHDKIIELLSAYVIYLSTKKKEQHKNEAMIKLQKFHLQREQYSDLLTRLETKSKAFEKKYDSISRLLSYWEQQAKVGFTRNQNIDR